MLDPPVLVKQVDHISPYKNSIKKVQSISISLENVTLAPLLGYNLHNMNIYDYSLRNIKTISTWRPSLRGELTQNLPVQGTALMPLVPKVTPL